MPALRPFATFKRLVGNARVGKGRRIPVLSRCRDVGMAACAYSLPWYRRPSPKPIRRAQGGFWTAGGGRTARAATSGGDHCTNEPSCARLHRADGRTPKTAQRVDDQAAMRRGGVCPSVGKRLELGPRFGQGVKGVQKI